MSSKQTLLLILACFSLVSLFTSPVIAQSPTVVWKRGGHTEQTAFSELFPQGDRVVTGGYDGTIKVHWVSDGLLQKTISVGSRITGAMCGKISPTGAYLAVVSNSDGYMRMFRTSDWALLWTKPADSRGISPVFSLDETVVADRLNVRYVNDTVINGILRHRGDVAYTAGNLDYFGLSPDGTMLAWSNKITHVSGVVEDVPILSDWKRFSPINSGLVASIGNVPALGPWSSLSFYTRGSVLDPTANYLGYTPNLNVIWPGFGGSIGSPTDDSYLYYSVYAGDVDSHGNMLTRLTEFDRIHGSFRVVDYFPYSTITGLSTSQDKNRLAWSHEVVGPKLMPELKVINISDGSPILNHPGPWGRVLDACYSGKSLTYWNIDHSAMVSSHIVAALSSEMYFRLYHAVSGEVLCEQDLAFEGAGRGFTDGGHMTMSRDGRTIAICSPLAPGGTNGVQFYDISDPRHPVKGASIAPPTGLNFRLIRFAPDGNTFFVTDKENNGVAVRLYTRNGAGWIYKTTIWHDGNPEQECLDVSPDGTKLAVTSYGPTVYVHALPSCSQIAAFFGPGYVGSICFFANSIQLAVAATANACGIYTATTGALVRMLDGPFLGDISTISADPSGKALMLGEWSRTTYEGRVSVWQISNGHRYVNYNQEIGYPASYQTPWSQSLTFSPDGQFFVVARSDAAIAIAKNPLWIAPKLASVAVSPVSVPGGAIANGTVTLDNPATVDGTVVALSSTNPMVASVSASVTVTAGERTAPFPVTTSGVASNASVTITASLDKVVKTKAITVLPPVLSNLTLSSASVVGGATVTGTVTLSGNVAVDTAIGLFSANSKAHTPANVTVPNGSASSTFSITTDVVSAKAAGAISASLGGVVKSATLTVNPAMLSNFGLSSTNVIGGTSVTGTVLFATTVGVDTVVTLASANLAVHVPTSVTVPAGSQSAVFNIATDPVLVNTSGAITASFGGVTKSANMTIKPPAYSSFTLTPNPVKGGFDVTGIITMTGPVAADTVVSLTNTNARAALPGPSVTIPMGQASISITITTVSTTMNVSGVVKATIGTVSKSVSLTVKP